MTQRAPRDERCLYVSWRDADGSIHPVGLLRIRQRPDTGRLFSFAYLKLAEQLEGFGPLPGLPDLHQRYDQARLFPVFANRLMPRSRPDFDLVASWVDLDAEADPFEVLARTNGRRATDRIEVFAGPEPTGGGSSTVLFLARGIRYVDGAADAVSSLAVGDHLTLRDDPDNPVNSRAILLRVTDGQPVGYVPDYLVEHFHELRDLNGEDPVVTVEHVNGPDVAPHLRLLCRAEAPWPVGYQPFSDARFQPLVDIG